MKEIAPQFAPLETLLADLERAGDPRLCKGNGGWYCIVEFKPSFAGASFEIRSDFKHPSPASAADQCFMRVEAARRGEKS